LNGGDDALRFVYLIGLLVLVGSGVVAMRMPIGRTLKIAGAWVIIFAVVFVGFTLREDFRALGRRLMSETAGVAEGERGELRIKRAEDGHFWVDVQLNGVAVRFLVDSGATVTAISSETARKAGIEPTGNYPVLVSTANGIAEARRGRARSLVVGSIRREDFPLHIAGALGDVNLLGMNFLSSLGGWRVEGEWLVLEP
jgi:aspartyl protease family protein